MISNLYCTSLKYSVNHGKAAILTVALSIKAGGGKRIRGFLTARSELRPLGRRWMRVVWKRKHYSIREPGYARYPATKYANIPPGYNIFIPCPWSAKRCQNVIVRPANHEDAMERMMCWKRWSAVHWFTVKQFVSAVLAKNCVFEKNCWQVQNNKLKYGSLMWFRIAMCP